MGRASGFTRSPLAKVLLVFALAWAVLELGHPPCPLHGDTHEDLLVARACVEQGRCASAGARTTVPSIHQGSLWISLLAVLRSVPVSVSGIHSLTFALAAAGIALVFGFLRGRSERVAWATAALSCLGLLYGRSLHVPWNPSLTPLPAALLFVLCLDHAERGRWWGALPLGLALGLTVETHPVAVLVVPGTLLLAGLASRGRVAASSSPLVTGTVAFALYAAMSPGAALGNAAAAKDAMGWEILAGALGVTVAAGVLHARFRRAGERARATAAAALLAAPVVVAFAARWLASGDAPVGARYLAPAFPALAYLLAVSCDRILARRAAQRALAAAAAVAALHPAFDAGTHRPTLPAIESVAATLREEGTTLDEAFARVSGPECQDVIGGFAAVGMPLGDPLEELPSESLLFAMAARLEGARVRDLERGRWRTISTPAGDVLVGEMGTWVDRRRFSACVYTGTTGEPPTCFERDLGAGIRALMGPELEMSRLSEPRVRWREDLHDGRVAHRVVYELPIRVPPGAGRRTLRIPPIGDYECPSTRFLAVDGVRATSPLPSRSVTLESTADRQEGVVRIEAGRGACGETSLNVFPPCLSEVAPGDGPALRRILGAP